ncbi:hypothetical protein [Frankia sp. KB5]|uniref:hypothetical protein n=1 Tax=Frankia sp. KB5 TaxID=683318 RepID=UPI0010561B4B|nr:hypothetical protein [Frankia sp. KB5]
MSEDEPPHNDGDDASRWLAEPLGLWERLYAGLAGVALSVAGVWAVFGTAREAGPPFLLLTGTAFLFIAIQGTAVRRLGGDSGIEMERRVRRQLASQVVEAARNEGDPDIARGMTRAAEIIVPYADRGLDMQRVALTYELLIEAALVSLGADVVRIQNDGPYDLSANFSESDLQQWMVRVIVKYRSSGSRFDRRAIPREVGGRRIVAALIVTNAPLTSEVQAINEDSGEEYGSVAVVTYRDASDDSALRNALRALGAPVSGDLA